MLNLHNRLRSAQLFLARLSLQTHFLLIIISALFLALVIWVAFNSTTERMEEHIGARFSEKQVLYDKAHTLQPLIRKVALASQMANNAIIKQWAANEQNPQLHRQALAKIEILCQRFQCDSYFLALAQSGHYYSINFSGQYLDNTTQSKQMRYTLDTVKPADSWFYTAIKDRGDYLINVDSDVNLGVANIQINVPLRDGGKVLGVIGTTLKMTGQMFDAPQSGVSSIFMDRNAIVQILRDVNHINFPNFIKPSGRKYSIDYLLDNPEDRAWVRHSIGQFKNNSSTMRKILYIKGEHYLARSSATTKFVHINGKRYLASITELPEVGWYDISLLDMSVLLPQHYFLEMWLAIGMAVLSLIAILLFSLHRLVLRPIAVLTAASDRIRQGNYADALPRKTRGEIGQLTEQFQAMCHAVYKTHNWMEGEIRKRTHQLIESKGVLKISLQMERNNRENLSNMLSIMAHEIRSPIAAISNTAQMLNVLVQSECPDLQPRIEKIMREALQITVLMNKFFDEDRINMKCNELNLQTGDLNIFCMKLTGTLSENYSRSIRYSPWSGDAMLLADWYLVGIAIGNLIDNAIKYSPPDSDIDLSVVQGKADTLCIEVTDQGPGIPPEIQQRIFIEKFIRGDNQRSKIYGTGIGLYLSNWIAMLHGGYADVSSTQNGNTFRICLPMRDQPR